MATPLQYSCLESPTDRGARRAIVHGVAELATAEHTHKGSCAVAWGWVEGGLDTAEGPGHLVQLPGSPVKLGSCLEDNPPCDEQAGSIPELPQGWHTTSGVTEPHKSPDKPGRGAQAPESQRADPGWVTPLLGQNSSGSRMDNLGTALAPKSTAL